MGTAVSRALSREIVELWRENALLKANAITDEGNL